MATAPADPRRDDTAAEVDRLYWHSDDTVDAIAERLEITRHGLYSLILPHPAGETCAECGAELVYANRSSRSAGRARCPDCGATATLPLHPDDREDDERPEGGASAWRIGAEGLEPLDGGDADPLPVPGAGPDPLRPVLLGGAALLGAALGAGVAGWLRRR